MRHRLALLLSVLAVASCAAAHSADVTLVPSDDPSSIADLRGKNLTDAQARPTAGAHEVAPDERSLRQHSRWSIGSGDFALRATVTLDLFEGRGSGFVFDGGSIVLDDPNWGAVLAGRLFGGGTFPFETERPGSARAGAPVEVLVERRDGTLSVRINEFEMGSIGLSGFDIGRIGFDLGGGALRVLSCSVSGDIRQSPRPLAIFTGADGDIDEYRDPAMATNGTSLLVGAIAVSTREDGSTMQRVVVRSRDGSGGFSPPHAVDLPEVDPDYIALGHRTGEARPWLLAVQAAAPKRMAREILLFDSSDGQSFAPSGRINCAGTPVRLISGAMQPGPDGSLWLGATRVEDGKPVAAALSIDRAGSGSLRTLVSDPSCDPILFGEQLIVVRTPGEGTRTALTGRDASNRSSTASTRFEGSMAIGAPIGSTGVRMRIAQPDPAFPYPLREIGTDDGGATWTKRSTIWGGAAGHITSIRTNDAALLLFEGGDKARREHVLLVEAKPDFDREAPTPTSPAPPQPGSP